VYETSLRFDGHKHEDYKNHTAVLNVQYRKSDTSEYQLAANQAAIKKCNEDIKNSDEKTHTLKLNNRKIPKNDKIGLLLKRKVWKEKNDNHVFRSKIPGLGMKVKLTNETGEDISVGIASIHRDSFVEIDNGVSNNWEWKLDHPTLPQNGFVVYWRRIEI